jgi:hypothetical protein
MQPARLAPQGNGGAPAASALLQVRSGPSRPRFQRGRATLYCQQLEFLPGRPIRRHRQPGISNSPFGFNGRQRSKLESLKHRTETDSQDSCSLIRNGNFDNPRSAVSNYRHQSIDFRHSRSQTRNSSLHKCRRHRSLRKSVTYRDTCERHSFWHTAITVLRSRRWAGSPSMRGNATSPTPRSRACGPAARSSERLELPHYRPP